MISGVRIDFDGDVETLRLTTRAMMEIERVRDMGIVSVLEGLEADFRVGTVVDLLAACAGDGAGIPQDRALAILDAVGMEAAMVKISKAAELAFPQASDQGKNGKRAARSK